MYSRSATTVPTVDRHVTDGNVPWCRWLHTCEPGVVQPDVDVSPGVCRAWAGSHTPQMSLTAANAQLMCTPGRHDNRIFKVGRQRTGYLFCGAGTMHAPDHAFEGGSQWWSFEWPAYLRAPISVIEPYSPRCSLRTPLFRQLVGMCCESISAICTLAKLALITIRISLNTIHYSPRRSKHGVYDDDEAEHAVAAGVHVRCRPPGPSAVARRYLYRQGAHQNSV